MTSTSIYCRRKHNEALKTNCYRGWCNCLSEEDKLILRELQYLLQPFTISVSFYRAMHVMLARYCYRKSSLRLSVPPSVRDVEVPWACVLG